ncbi:hypothetical protein [Endozoicomonas sp. 8E]|uniref:hypothetical protein n=1 Tax=Endozoicomonas sp. 8E TaxID=3035692 RepID=UPI002938F6ED|nr:hypothetical protein [Endozoicomonas sp. 8E]WOG28261.1 hypothetical protein P6910_01020 [Endozoicomonas sp. 8E]
MLESERNYRPATADKIRDVVALTVLNYRHFVSTDQYLYSDREVRKRCGIIRQNWCRDFAVWKHLYLDRCDQLDRVVLTVIADARKRHGLIDL